MVYQYQPFMDRFFWVDPIVLPTFEVILCPTSRVADADVCLYTGMPACLTSHWNQVVLGHDGHVISWEINGDI